MNAYSKNAFISWIVNAGGCVLLILFAFNTASAAPCLKDPQRAYEYLLAQENLAIQARDQKIIDINRANEGELTSLHGIGSSKAQAIILYRDMFGNFKTVDELANVKGIGAKTIEKNRARLRV